jgi:predicted aspartyl protease
MLISAFIALKSIRQIAKILFLSSLFIVPRSSVSQTSGDGKRRSIKVKVVSNLIVMPGYVNNSERLEVVLDTGASQNVLMPGLALKLNLHPTISANAEGIGKGQDETMHISSGARLAFGYDKELTLDDQSVAALPIEYISQQTGHQVDAIFGSSLFTHFHIRVDYEHSEVTFDSGSELSTSGTPIPITVYGDEPYVEATFETATGEKVRARFLVDSGTTGDLILNRNCLNTHPAIAKEHVLVDTPQVTAVGGSIEAKLLRITGLELGPFHIAAPVAYVPNSVVGALADNDIAGFIGAGILSHFTVDWDYALKIMTLTPNQHVDEPFEPDASGMRLIAAGPDWKTVQVAAISPGGPAAEAGLQIGDILNSIDGIVLPPLFELKKLLSRPGSSISFTLFRSGKQSTMTIHMRRLV